MTERMIDLSLVSETDDIENLYLTFEVAQETYAVNIRHVTEIVGMQRISAMPDVPNFIRGAMNLRGKVIPVMDLRMRFGLPWLDYTDRTTIIVLDLNGAATGLVVDKVTDVLTISPDNIELPSHWHRSAKKSESDEPQQSVVSGLGRHGDGLSIILDVPNLLSDKELILDSSALREAASQMASASPESSEHA